MKNNSHSASAADGAHYRRQGTVGENDVAMKRYVLMNLRTGDLLEAFKMRFVQEDPDLTFLGATLNYYAVSVGPVYDGWIVTAPNLEGWMLFFSRMAEGQCYEVLGEL